MTGIFSILNIGLQAVLAEQRAIEVSSHNVSNANTPGYHRQQIEFKAGIPTTTGDMFFGGLGQFGTGVLTDRINRSSDDFLDLRYRAAQADSKRDEVKTDLLQQLETTNAEMSDGGLIKKLDNFWDSWQQLSGDPTSTPLLSQVREQGKALAEAFNSRIANMQTFKSDQDITVKERVTEVNDMADKLVRLNADISHALAAGQQPNDLLDERDTLLDRLAEVAGATSSKNANGEVDVSIGGHVLVFGQGVQKLVYDDSTKTYQWADGQPYNGTSGELTGIAQAQQFTTDQMKSLNDLAAGVIQWVNDIQQTTYSVSQNSYASAIAPLVPPAAGNIWMGGNGVAALNSFTDPNVPPVITGAGVGALTHRELASGTYSIETRTGSSGAQFRIKNADGTVMEIDNGTGTLTNDWISIPPGGTYDTGRGFTVTFNNPAATGQDATINYTARGISIALAATDSLTTIAQKINASVNNQPEGRETNAIVLRTGTQYQLFLNPINAGSNHAIDPNTQINGITLNTSTTPPPFFDGMDAWTMQVSGQVQTDLSNITTSKVPVYAPGDGSIAAAMANGRNATNFVVSNPPGGPVKLDNADDAYNMQITQMGLEISYSQSSHSNRAVIAGAISQQRESLQGVSLDEEATKIMQYQRSFEAAAKLVSVANGMADVIINGLIK